LAVIEFPLEITTFPVIFNVATIPIDEEGYAFIFAAFTVVQVMEVIENALFEGILIGPLMFVVPEIVSIPLITAFPVTFRLVLTFREVADVTALIDNDPLFSNWNAVDPL